MGAYCTPPHTTPSPVFAHQWLQWPRQLSGEGEWRKSSLTVAIGVQVGPFITSLENSDALQQHAEIRLGLMKAMKPALNSQMDFHGDS